MSNRSLRGNIIDRFFAQIDKGPGYGPKGNCWRWTGTYTGRKKPNGKPREGYGVIYSAAEKRQIQATHVSFYIHNRVWPTQLNHTCDWTPCVNPDHLYDGSQSQNARDALERGRLKPFVGSKNGCAKLKESQVREIRVRYSAGEDTQKQLGEEYGVSEHAIWQIVHYVKWKHVDP